MPPPSTDIEKAWASSIVKSPELRTRWGTELPRDKKGNINMSALFDLMSFQKMGKIRTLSQKPVATSGPTPTPISVPTSTYDVRPPDPVDWGQRTTDVKNLLFSDWGSAFRRNVKNFLDERLGREPKDVDPLPSWVPQGTPLTAEKLGRGMEAIDKISRPVRGMAVGIVNPAVRERTKILRDQGFGDWASAQAAYEQAVEAGDVPWWQYWPAEIVGDLSNLLPGIGFGKPIAKAAFLGTRKAVPSAIREASRGAVAPVAARVAEKVVPPVSDSAPWVTRGTMPTAARTSREEIEDIISRVPETSTNVPTNIKSASDNVKKYFDEFLDYERITDNERKRRIFYISKHTGRTKDDISDLISKAVYDEPAPVGLEGEFTTTKTVDFLSYVHFKSDWMRRLVERVGPASTRREKWLARIFTPAAIAGKKENKALREGVLYRLLQELQESRAGQKLLGLATTRVAGVSGRPLLGGKQELFNIIMEGPEKGKIVLLDGSKKAFGDVAENSTEYFGKGLITKPQEEWIKEAQNYIDELARNYQHVSGKKIVSVIKGREHYWPRFTETTDGIRVSSSENLIGAKVSSMNQRLHEFMEDSIKSGTSYVPDPSTQLRLYSQGINKAIRDSIFETRLLSDKGPGPVLAVKTSVTSKTKTQVPKWQSKRGWKNIQITEEASKQLEQPMGLRFGGDNVWVQRGEMLSAIPKLLIAGAFDLGHFMIQGAVLSFTSPKRSAIGMMRALEVLFSRSPNDVFNLWMTTKYLKKVENASKYGIDVSELLEYYQLGGSAQKTMAGSLGVIAKAPVVGKPTAFVAGRFGHAFHAYMAIARIELFDAMSEVARVSLKSSPMELQAELLRLAKLADSVAGTTSTKALGLSATQRQVEQMFIFFAPRYTRAVFASIAHAAGTGMRASQARKLLGRFIGVAVTFVAAGNGLSGLASGKSREETTKMILDSLDPSSGASFMSIKIGDQFYGIGGTYRSLTSALWELVGWSDQKRDASLWEILNHVRNLELKEAGTDVTTRNPIITFWMNRASVPTGILSDFIERENFEGQEFTLSAFVEQPDRLVNELFKRTTPIPIQALLENLHAGRAIPETSLSFLAEFMGGRSYPVSPGRRKRAVRDDMVANTFGAGTQKDYPGVVHSSWEEIKDDRVKRLIVERDPSNKNLMLEVEKIETEFRPSEEFESVESRGRDKIDKEISELSVKLFEKYMGRLMDPPSEVANEPRSFRDGLKKLTVRRRSAIETLEERLKEYPEYIKREEEEPDRAEKPEAWAIHRYHKIIDQSKDEFGDQNKEELERLLKEEQIGWPEYLVKYIDRYGSMYERKYTDDRIKAYYAAARLLGEDGLNYWEGDLTVLISRLDEAYKDLDIRSLWEKYSDQNTGPNERRNMEQSRDSRVRRSLKVLKLNREEQRKRIRANNSEADRALVIWYGSKPVRRENVGLWNRLYGKIN